MRKSRRSKQEHSHLSLFAARVRFSRVRALFHSVDATLRLISIRW
jgi:hypothetical protein